MAARGDKERTVAFFEVVDDDGARLEQVDWQTILNSLQRRPLRERTYTTSLKTFVGQVVSYDGQSHLLLGKVKETDDWLEEINFEDGSIEEFNRAENRGLVETSILSFLDFGNVVGMIRGSVSAPTCASLQEWINGMDILEGVNVEVRPIIDRATIEKIRQADGARWLDFKVNTSQAAAFEESGNRLGRTVRAARDEYGEVTVAFKVEIPKNRRFSRARRELLNDVLQLAAHSDITESASAQLTYWDPSDDSEHSEAVNLMKHRITAKKRIAGRDDEGNPIRNLSAVHAILEVAVKHDAELRLAVDDPSD